MKKQLLLATALFSAISAFPQSKIVKAKPSRVINMAEQLAQKFALSKNVNETPGPVKATTNTNVAETPAEALKTVNTTAATWQVISGSRNVYGVLYSQSEPLQYNDNLNAVSFVHRASATYVGQPSTPSSESGAMVAMISPNWGASWDSTCFFSDNSNYARYPQGAIYNPPGNTNMSSAYITGSGPVTDGADWKGCWYGSKQLGAGNYNAVGSSTPNAMQILSNTSPPAFGKHDFPSYSYAATDDGKVRSIGVIVNDINGTTNSSFGFRGAMVTKGTFNAGVFTWSGDSIIPNTIVRTDGSKQCWSQPIMAWNESGTIGYVVFIGAAAGSTGSNKGWQPIIYKTSNSGTSWATIPGIDFNLPAMNPIKASIATVNTNTSLEVPFFQIGEGYDAIVDNLGKLHIVSTVVGTSSTHNDTLEYTYQFGTENYSWPHTPGQRPYLYDFISDGTGPWTFVTVDSLSTEGPGDRTTDGGYSSNPWDADPGNSNSKITSDSRIQASRTHDGAAVLYTWAESDTNFTNSQVKWNSLPNIKARAYNALTATLSPTEINVTKPLTGANPNVSNRAMLHYASPTALLGSCSGNTTTIKLPLTVTNSNPYSQLSNNKHWYSTAGLDFLSLGCTIGFNHSLAYNVNAVDIYPNPANSNATIAIDLKEEGNVTVNIFNTIGQLVKTINTKGQLGENKMNVDLTDLSSGIYMVKVNIGNTTSTKKLIVE